MPSSEYFDTAEMLPDSFLYLEERSEFLFMPLFIGNLHFGFAVFLIDALQENVFESLCEQISHSLNRQLLLDKRKKAEEVFIYNAINIINGHLQIMKV